MLRGKNKKEEEEEAFRFDKVYPRLNGENNEWNLLGMLIGRSINQFLTYPIQNYEFEI